MKMVSVIIPTYNSSNFIDHCVRSVSSQTYENIEIIIVDGGSTDDTLSKCQKMAEDDSRIKVFQPGTDGLCAARNYGIIQSQGDYITFVDSDDYVDIKLIEKYIDGVEHFAYEAKKTEDFEDVAMVLCGIRVEVMVGAKKEEERLSRKRTQKPFLRREKVVELTVNGLFGQVTNKLYFGDVIRDNNILFEEDMHLCSDYLFNVRYLEAKAGGFGMINEPLYHEVSQNVEAVGRTYYPNVLNDTERAAIEVGRFASGLENTTEADIKRLSSYFLHRWTARAAAMYDLAPSKEEKKKLASHAQSVIVSDHFQKMLEDSKGDPSMNSLAYWALKNKSFSTYIRLHKTRWKFHERGIG